MARARSFSSDSSIFVAASVLRQEQRRQRQLVICLAERNLRLDDLFFEGGAVAGSFSWNLITAARRGAPPVLVPRLRLLFFVLILREFLRRNALLLHRRTSGNFDLLDALAQTVRFARLAPIFIGVGAGPRHARRARRAASRADCWEQFSPRVCARHLIPWAQIWFRLSRY